MRNTQTEDGVEAPNDSRRGKGQRSYPKEKKQEGAVLHKGAEHFTENPYRSIAGLRYSVRE